MPAPVIITDVNSIPQGTVTNPLYTSSRGEGNVSIAPSGYSAVLSVTRPNDTSAYAAGDVQGNASGSTAAMTFPLAAGQFMITGASLELDIASVPSGMTSFNLELYSATPPSALGDNAPWDLPAGDRPSYLGVINLGSPVDVGSTLYVYSAQINQQIALPTANLFGYLTTVGAYTPAASTVGVVTVYGLVL